MSDVKTARPELTKTLVITSALEYSFHYGQSTLDFLVKQAEEIRSSTERSKEGDDFLKVFDEEGVEAALKLVYLSQVKAQTFGLTVLAEQIRTPDDAYELAPGIVYTEAKLTSEEVGSL